MLLDVPAPAAAVDIYYVYVEMVYVSHKTTTTITCLRARGRQMIGGSFAGAEQCPGTLGLSSMKGRAIPSTL